MLVSANINPQQQSAVPAAEKARRQLHSCVVRLSALIVSRTDRLTAVGPGASIPSAAVAVVAASAGTNPTIPPPLLPPPPPAGPPLPLPLFGQLDSVSPGVGWPSTPGPKPYYCCCCCCFRATYPDRHQRTRSTLSSSLAAVLLLLLLLTRQPAPYWTRLAHQHYLSCDLTCPGLT